MSRKIVGLAVFVVAIAAAAAGAFFLIDAGDDPRNAPQDSFVFVDFTRSGGFTGITQHLLVRTDGEAVLTTGEGAADAQTIEFDLAPETLDRLERVLPEAVRGLDEEPRSGVGCADCFQYDLIYEGVRYTFFDLPTGPRTTEMLKTLDHAICEGESPNGTCS
ncbi:MAG: hypothetical protein M3516_00765 [Actinomycetota bacterium]|nr:hypothetical protein [Actinomycetota bacterium]